MKEVLAVKIDRTLKKKFFEKCKKVGLKPSEVIRIFVRQAIGWHTRTFMKHLLGADIRKQLSGLDDLDEWEFKELSGLDDLDEELKGLEGEELKGLEQEELKGLEGEELKGLEQEELKGLSGRRKKKKNT